MSALARLFLHEGKEVSGSDSSPSAITDALQEEGVQFFKQENNTTIYDSVKNIDLVVYTEAMSKDHKELVEAREKGIKTINYFEALGMVANPYYLVAVSGTHGKSTTTAMLVDIFEEAGKDPSAIVGSLRSKTGSNYRAGKSQYMIAEACEYRRNFLYLEPDVLVITNLEHEHVDYYKSLADVQSAFRELALKVPAEGAVVCDTADANVKPVIDGLSCQVIDYRQYLDPMLQLKQPGVHNQLNAVAAIAVATHEGIEVELAKRALENFAGIWRRFEYKGDVNGAPVYDDYAHHPTEIKAAIAGVREKYPSKKLTVVFQPHTYTRTAELFDNFVEALAQADRVLMVPIYAARETNESGVSSEQIIEKITESGTSAEHFHTLEAATLNIRESVSNDDVVVVMGAGDVTKIASNLTN